MEQNLSSFSAAATAKPAKKKMSRTKLVLIIIGGVIALLILCFVFVTLRFRIAVFNAIADGCEAEYTFDESGDRDLGRQPYCKDITVNDRTAKMCMTRQPGLIMKIELELKLYEPVSIGSTKCENLSIYYMSTQIPWDHAYFLKYSYREIGATTHTGVYLTENGEPTKEENENITAEERLLLKELEPYYMPMLDKLKSEYERITDTY